MWLVYYVGGKNVRNQFFYHTDFTEESPVLHLNEVLYALNQGSKNKKITDRIWNFFSNMFEGDDFNYDYTETRNMLQWLIRLD
jgi:hypothetical protein